MAPKSNEYSSETIISLDQHTHLLKRLSLTFGSETGDPKHPFSSQKGVAIREILDNALDEIRGGYGSWVRLAFYADRSVEIQDSGRGIPADASLDGNGRMVSGIFKALGIIQSGGKFSADSNRFSSGLNGVGASSTVHTSKRADITVYRKGKSYKLSFKDGVPGFFAEENDPDAAFTELEDYSYVLEEKDTRPAAEKKKYPSGTTVKVWLRDSVFQSEYPYDDQDIIERLKGTAFLVPQLHAEVYNELHPVEDPETGESRPQEEYFHFDEGVLDLINLNQTDNALMPTLHITTEGHYVERNVPVLQKDGKVKAEDLERRTPIELAFSYGSGYDSSIQTFVNTIYTKLDGVHLTALERAMTRAFNERFQTMRGLLTKSDELPNAEDFKEGLTAVLSVQIAEPQFTSQSKEQLGGREVQKAIEAALFDEFDSWIKDPKNTDTLQLIARKVTTAAKNRQKAREQRDLNRKKNEISSSSLPAKLVDCEFSGTDNAELYIAEGESAKSSLKEARDGKVHAILPIRGKIINANKANSKALFANAEVQDIIKTLGAGSGADFDLDKMRYGRVFVASDADPDGNAIACLLYTLFWKLFKPVIEEGRFFKIETPLFVFNLKDRNHTKVYVRDERERDATAAKLDKQGKKYTVTRIKGLGELSASDMRASALNPETRIITQITLSDVEKAEEMLEILMGDDAAPRKVWIENLEIDEELLGE